MRENKTPRQVLAIGRDFRALAQWLGVMSSRSEDGLGSFPRAARPLAKVVWDAFRGFPFQMWLRVPLIILHLVASVELFPPSLAAVEASRPRRFRSSCSQLSPVWRQRGVWAQTCCRRNGLTSATSFLLLRSAVSGASLIAFLSLNFFISKNTNNSIYFIDLF